MDVPANPTAEQLRQMADQADANAFAALRSAEAGPTWLEATHYWLSVADALRSRAAQIN